MLNHEQKPRGARLALLLILLLAGSNLATAIGAYLIIDRISGRYIEDIHATAPGMHDVMMLAQDATDVHRAAAALLVARTPAEETQMLARLAEARARERHRRNQISNTPFRGRDAMASRAALDEAAVAYDASVRVYLDLLKTGDRQAAQDHRLSGLREAFEHYQKSQREESVRLNIEAMQGGAELSTYASSRKSWLLSIGAWPFVIFGLMFVAVTTLGVMLWRQLRRMETDEDGLAKSHRLKF